MYFSIKTIPPESFSVSKFSFMKENVEYSHKQMSVKCFFKIKIYWETLRSRNSSLDLWSWLWCYCGDIWHKIQTSLQTLVSKNARHGCCKNLSLTINLYKKQCLQVMKWNKKHSSKQALLITYPLGEEFFAVTFLEGCETFFQSENSW